MHLRTQPRQAAALTVGVLALVFLAACSGQYPNSTFNPTTEFNRESTSLWNTLLVWGTIVFVIVEAILIYTIWRYRRRPGVGVEASSAMMHGNTTLEIAWTVLPALILAIISVPTVRAIFRTQAPAPANALKVDVIGHQWWWEFRYPEYNITTANELYLPIGRPVAFTLRTVDVIHSFWIPQLGGKRDVVSNRTNYLWFTPDSAEYTVYNGSCNEYCGASHANMRFRVFTVPAENFEQWAAHQRTPAMIQAPAAAPAAGTPAPNTPATATPQPNAAAANQPPAAPAPTQAVGSYVFPRDRVPAYAIPATPVPADVSFPENLVGDIERGRAKYSSSACIGCHKIEGNPMSVGVTGPNLTHVGSRLTIGAGLFPNDPRHMALWIKNARKMKPLQFSSMPTLGKGEYDPVMKTVINVGGLTDQEIADIVAYLQALK
ncbi:MAG TPA: cytochrome c oxidase subunit II [Gemmatimonadaceae bacterium]|jgi:cytochrome c oxidase subunit 2|nr:cytochrome c oxidase subunit II [Gemmatimonadaceae bacterium]